MTINRVVSTHYEGYSEYWNQEVSNVWSDRHIQIDNMFANLTGTAIQVASAGIGESVLDVGCGAGTTTLALAKEVGNAGRVVGIDISRRSVTCARERIKRAGLLNAEIILADARSYPFAPGSFDLVFSRFGVMFFPEPVDALINLSRSMRKGGRLTFAVLRSREENQFVMEPYAAVAHLLPPDTDFDPEEPRQFSWADPERVRHMLGASGFHNVSLAAHDSQIPFSEAGHPEDAADLSLRLGPISRIMSTMRTPPTELVRSALEVFFRHRDGPNGVVLSTAAWIVRASAISSKRRLPS